MFTTAKTTVWEEKLSWCLAHFFAKHPFLAFLFLFAALPLGVFLALALFTTCVSLPLALFLEWI